VARAFRAYLHSHLHRRSCATRGNMHDGEQPSWILKVISYHRVMKRHLFDINTIYFFNSIE
jgi:hypothetical protein